MMHLMAMLPWTRLTREMLPRAPLHGRCFPRRGHPWTHYLITQDEGGAGPGVAKGRVMDTRDGLGRVMDTRDGLGRVMDTRDGIATTFYLEL